MFLENGLWKVSSSHSWGHQGNCSHFLLGSHMRDHDKCSWEKVLWNVLST